MAKINISLDDNLLDRLDKVADDNYMSRSGLISVACAQYINAREVSLALKDISLSIRKIADTGKIDHDSIQQLEDFERLCKMMTA